MYSLKLVKVLALVFLVAQISLGARYQVGKDGYPYSTIQSAIVDAKKAKDASPEIVIMDFETYKEQVTIDSMNNVTLRSDNPVSTKKPVIMWKDVVNTHPHNNAESTIPNLANSFDENGALRILYSRGVTINGITVDGVAPWDTGFSGVWKSTDGTYSGLLVGNTGIHLTVSGDAKILNCEIKNCYWAINFKDRNLGGIFANPNPSDLDSLKNVPNSGFGKTGNHLVEYCKIHDNSWGMFFESSWDLGTVIRYNLFYEDHHNTQIASTIKNVPEGGNEPGGAFVFKDGLLSPLAIYNNTFWHCALIYCGNWKAGSEHLIFNNIYGTPNPYWQNVNSSYMTMDANYANRTHNCIYAVQQQPLDKGQANFVQVYDNGLGRMVTSDTVWSYQAQLINGLTVKGSTFTLTATSSSGQSQSQTFNDQRLPGNLIIGGQAGSGFPESANVRWLETKFKSTDPSNSDFLVPDWNDSLVNRYIRNQGWSEAGVRNADGTIADLGAIPFSGLPKTETTIKPTFPIILNGSSLTLMFDVTNIAGTMASPVIKYFTLINNIVSATDLANSKLWSKDVSPVPVSNIIPLNPVPVTIGGNTVNVNIPPGTTMGKYAFVEMTIEGTDPLTGNKVTSSVGFLPYRQLDYGFTVEVLDATSGNKLDTVKVGVPVKLRITPYKVTTKNIVFTQGDISPVDVKLSSNFPLLSNASQTPFVLNKVSGVTITDPVVFTKVPSFTGGFDRVAVNGIYGTYPFGGISNQLKILPGEPAKVLFQDPPSGGVGKVSPGVLYPVRVDVFDKYDNKVTVSADITLASLDPAKGNVSGPTTVKSDTGTAWFKVTPSDGANINDTFHLKATLVSNGYADNAKMVVDKNRAKFYIFYGDSAGPQNLNDSLKGEVGDRLPVLIRESSTNGIEPDTGYLTAKFVVVPSVSSLKFYSSATSTATQDTFTLVNGMLRIWVEGTSVISDQGLQVSAAGSPVRTGSRNNIYFKLNPTSVDTGIYYSDNGFGRVDRLELFYRENLDSTKLPDSLQLYWPNNPGANLRLVKRDPTNMKLDPANPKHITVTLPQPFPEGITTYIGTTSLGTAYGTQGGLVLKSNIKIHDCVNPLLASASLVERLSQTGNDTMFVRFTERVPYESLKGKSLILIKNGVPVTLNIISDTISAGDTIKIVVENAGANSPAGGDSLKINAAGTVRDNYGNAARPDNRPVVITVRTIPADIDSGIYKDLDGNGLVETATIYFKKKVNLANLKMVFTNWHGTNTDTLNYTNFTYGADSSKVVVNLANRFKNQKPTDTWTDQDMTVNVSFVDFPGQVRSGGVVDRAAPVLKSAELHPGKGSADGTWSKDELIVTFSEPVAKPAGPDKTPYKFFRTKIGGTEYEVQLTYKDNINGGMSYSYTIDNNIVPYPSTGDSVQIDGDTPIISDAVGNYQTIPNNLKVKLVVIPPQVDTLLVKLGPNPFRPFEGQKLKVLIDPLVKVAESVHLVMNFEIYDQLGNLLYQVIGKESDNSSAKFTFEWNGKNLNGRNVGMGSYMLVIKGRDTLSDNKIPATRKMIGIIR